MSPDPRPSCLDLMEPAVSGDVMPHEMASLASIAISLKRIADAIDGTAIGVDITESLAGLAYQLRLRP